MSDNVISIPKKNINDEAEKVINTLTEEATAIAEGNEDIMAVRAVTERAENYIPEEPLRSEVASFHVDKNGNPNYTVPADNSEDTSDATLLEIIDDASERGQEKFAKGLKDHASNKFNMSDADATKLLDCVLTYRKDPKINLYNMFPQSIKSLVNQIMMENQLPITERNGICKMIIQEFISEAETDNAFADFEAALNRAMKIPSLTDMYSEHLAETVDKKLPAMADAIEAEDPEKAKTLRTIAERFEWSISYEDIKTQYDNNTLIRKAVRRDYAKWHKLAEIVNYLIKDTKFKMPDATVAGTVLIKVLLEENGTDITEEDVCKFLTALYKGIDPYRENKIENMAYIYYMLKNIVMLSYTNEQAKGSFSAELISNIKTMIYYIRVRESEFNAINNKNMQQRKQGKRNKRK